MKCERLDGGGWYIRLGRLSMVLGRNGSVSGMPAGFAIVWKAKMQPQPDEFGLPRFAPVRGFIISGHWQEPNGFAPEPVNGPAEDRRGCREANIYRHLTPEPVNGD